MRVTLVAERGAARALVRAKQTAAALVVPAGTSAALAVGQPSQLILYTDPVRVIELDVIRDLVQEIRHELEVAARDKAAAELEATRTCARGPLRSTVRPPISVANSTTPRGGSRRAERCVARPPRGRARSLHKPDAPASRAESCGPAGLGSLLDPPSRFGPKSTVHRWFLKWVNAGVFESLMRAAGRCVEDTGGSASTNVSSMALFPKPRVAAIASVDGRWILFRDANILKADECSGSSTLGPSRMILRLPFAVPAPVARYGPVLNCISSSAMPVAVERPTSESHPARLQ